MQKHFLKFRKVFTNVTCAPLILLSNNLELSAEYLPNDVEKLIKNLEIQNINNRFSQGINIKEQKNFIFAENNNLDLEWSTIVS